MKNPWERHWGQTYHSKNQFIEPALRELEMQEKLGRVIVDVGSGKYPVSDRFKGDYKIIKLDIAVLEEDAKKREYINYDVEKLADENSFGTKKALAIACKKLDLNLREAKEKEQVDTVIFSEVLNYVDYKQVLESLAKYIKPGGRIIVFNSPSRGNSEMFSPQGLKGNEALIGALSEIGFEIEEYSFPWKDQVGEAGVGDFIVLVARKEV